MAARDAVELREELLELSQVGKTVDGTGHAYFELRCKGKSVGDIGILEQYLHLRQIDLSDNLIFDLSPLSGLAHILKLNLAHNAIESMDPLLALDHLLYLDLSGNKLTSLPALKMPYLKRANFARNRIATCEDWGGHPRLQALDLSENSLGALEGLAGMPLLETLSVGGNRLGSAAGLRELPRLASLDLSKNNFETLEGPFGTLAELMSLDVSGNQIKAAGELGVALRELSKLRRLGVAGNPLEEEEGVNVRLEVLIFQAGLQAINGEEVTPEERDQAKALLQKRAEAE